MGQKYVIMVTKQLIQSEAEIKFTNCCFTNASTELIPDLPVCDDGYFDSIICSTAFKEVSCGLGLLLLLWRVER